MPKRAREPLPFFRHCDTVGDGSGTKIMNVNGAVTPVPFILAPKAGERIDVARVIIHIESTMALRAEQYGSAGTLTNGITFKWFREGVEFLDFLDGFTFKAAADIGHYCYDVTPIQAGAGNNFWAARWTFANSGNPVELFSERQDRLIVTVRDNLTALVDHFWNFQGVRRGAG